MDILRTACWAPLLSRWDDVSLDAVLSKEDRLLWELRFGSSSSAVLS